MLLTPLCAGSGASACADLIDTVARIPALARTYSWPFAGTDSGAITDPNAATGTPAGRQGTHHTVGIANLQI